MSEQNAKIAGQIAGLVFKGDVVKNQGPNDPIPVYKAWMIPYHAGEESRAADEVKAKFNKGAIKGNTANLMSLKQIEMKIKQLEHMPEHANTVAELGKGKAAIHTHIALEKNPLGAHVNETSNIKMKTQLGLK
jgi:hypothetical protein